jgi:hypothetical protein
MTQAILTTVVSAVIAGIFGLLGKVLDARLKSVSVSASAATLTQTQNVPYSPYQSGATVTMVNPPVPVFSFGRVLIHIGILQLVVNVVGFVIGFILGVMGQVNAILPMILLFGTLSLIIGFIWVAMRVNKAFRWKHLNYVAIGVAIMTVIVNALILQTSITGAALIFALIQTFFAMSIGGVIANAFNK